jgi:hypothetical protein
MPSRRKKPASVFEKNAAYSRAIGVATGEMAILENALGELQAALLGIEAALGRTMYLSSHTAFGRLATLDVAAADTLQTGSALLDRVASITKRARLLLQGQHQMAHEIWRIAEGRHSSATRKGMAAQMHGLAQRARDARALAAEVRATIASVRRGRHGAKGARVSA